VLVVASAATRETLERWTFEVETCVDVKAQRAAERRGAAGAGGGGGGAATAAAAKPLPDKPEREITAEIQAIIRQITASVTFLPLLEDPCTFDLLVYTKKASALPRLGQEGGCEEDDAAARGEAEGVEGGLVPIPADWEESDPRYVAPGCAADVRLRSFTTKVHKVDTAVTYRASDD
jgi:mitotic spindle assembly checkpoint protein MAD2